MQTHANAQIAGRSFGFAHFLELRPSCGKLRPSSGKLRSSCGFVFSRALHQASRQPQKVLELDLSRKKRSNAKNCLEHFFVYQRVLQVLCFFKVNLVLAAPSPTTSSASPACIPTSFPYSTQCALRLFFARFVGFLMYCTSFIWRGSCIFMRILHSKGLHRGLRACVIRTVHAFNAPRSFHAFRVLLAHAFAFRAPHGFCGFGAFLWASWQGRVYALSVIFVCFVHFGLFCAAHPTSCVSLVSAFVGLLCTCLIRAFREAPAPPCPLRAFWCVSWVF